MNLRNRRTVCFDSVLCFVKTQRGISSVGRAFGWQPKGHRFEPGILHLLNTFNGCILQPFCISAPVVGRTGLSVKMSVIAAPQGNLHPFPVPLGARSSIDDGPKMHLIEFLCNLSRLSSMFQQSPERFGCGSASWWFARPGAA